jgi:hypothetical protein
VLVSSWPTPRFPHPYIGVCGVTRWGKGAWGNRGVERGVDETLTWSFVLCLKTAWGKRGVWRGVCFQAHF